jgi:CubicO group peptidase (beta-lactamase class C family)
MNTIQRALLTAGLLLGVSAAAAQDGDLDAYLETVRTTRALPALAAAVVKDGEIIASGAVGVRALGRDVPVTIDDRFHIGSDTPRR